MGYSPLTNRYRPTSQSSSRLNARVDMVVGHHMAGTDAEGVARAMISGSRQVSSNYIITNEGEIWCMVDEGLRAWTSGSGSDGGKGAAIDRRAITVEIENQSTVGWTISPAAFNAFAALLADVHKRLGVPLSRANMIGHREEWERWRASYPTACPGGLNMDAAVATAAKSLQPAPEPPKKPKPKGKKMILIRNEGGSIAALLPHPTTPELFVRQGLTLDGWGALAGAGYVYVQVSNAQFNAYAPAL